MFFRWARKAGIVKASPARKLPAISAPAGVPKPAPQAAYVHALERATPNQRIMLMLARYAGLRCCEIAAVRGADFDGEGLHVVGKGGKARLVPIVHAELISALESTPDFLFPFEESHISARWVSRQLGALLPGEWSAHSLRHAYASTAYANGADIYAIAMALGHSKVETTQRYTRMPLERLRSVAEAAG